MIEAIGETSTIYNNTGTGKERSCITELIQPFPPGAKVKVFSNLEKGDCRGEFVVSSSEYETSGFAKILGVRPGYRIFSEGELPQGTTTGDVLVSYE